MSNNFLKFLVIFLAALIVICFALLLYGFYSKISNNQKISNNDVLNFSLNLKSSENIKDIKIIDQNNVLIVISDNDQLYLIMYNLKNNKSKDKENSFESNLQKLEKIVDKLESGEIGLEESVKLYEEGMKIKKICDKKLQDIEMQIKKIKIEDNKISKEDF